MLEGKIALVTGAAKGIGRAIALALAADGATVIVNYNGSAQKAEAVVDEIKALGKDSEAYQCNVANTADVDAMIKDVIKRYGSLDILVNNAGITRDNLIMKMSEEDFDAVIDANLKGCFNTIKAVSRQMLKQRAGRIINITSVSGILGNAGQANYAASKAGIIGLTKTMARELASRGITVNGIAPDLPYCLIRCFGYFALRFQGKKPPHQSHGQAAYLHRFLNGLPESRTFPFAGYSR